MSETVLPGISACVPSALSLGGAGSGTFPAINLAGFVEKTFLATSSRLYIPDHEHLLGAKIGYLFTDVPASRKGLDIMGQAEMPSQASGSKWAKARQEQQIIDWFGQAVDFLITLYAPYVLTAPPVHQLALLD